MPPPNPDSGELVINLTMLVAATTISSAAYGEKPMINEVRRQAAFEAASVSISAKENPELLPPNFKPLMFLVLFARHEDVRDFFKDVLTPKEQESLVRFAKEGISEIDARVSAIDVRKRRSLVCDQISALSDMEIASRLDRVSHESRKTLAKEYWRPVKALSEPAQQAIAKWMTSNVNPSTSDVSWTSLAFNDIEVFRDEVANLCEPNNTPEPPPTDMETTEAKEPTGNGNSPGALGSMPRKDQ